MPQIVSINVSQQVAANPNTLQRTGAFVSQGATNLPAGTSALLTVLDDLTPLYAAGLALSGLVYAAGIVTATTVLPLNLPMNDKLKLTIAGVTPAAYNGTYTCTVTGANTFTFAISLNPGTVTAPGIATPEDVAELCAMATTFFAQGSMQSVYVLELGLGGSADGIPALDAYITANPNQFYGFLVPRYWGASPLFQPMTQKYQSPSAKVYFWSTVQAANYNQFVSVLDKQIIQMVEAPNIPVTEFSLAAFFQAALRQRPGDTNRVTPFNYTYLYGVTPYPTFNNSALLTTLNNAGVNYIGQGTEGGISNAMLVGGKTMDNRPLNYWYSADWMQINLDRDLANVIINGSNNPVNPLYFNQNGIDRLQARAAKTVSSGVSFGLVLGSPKKLALDGPDLADVFDESTYPGMSIVNAIPFVPYCTENPGDYKIGNYGGLSVTFVPLRGFDTITINLVISDFVTG